MIQYRPKSLRLWGGVGNEVQESNDGASGPQTPKTNQTHTAQQKLSAVANWNKWERASILAPCYATGVCQFKFP